MSNMLIRLLKEEDGPTAVEYAVMLALILITAIAGIRFLGSAVNGSFDNSQQSINTAMGS